MSKLARVVSVFGVAVAVVGCGGEIGDMGSTFGDGAFAAGAEETTTKSAAGGAGGAGDLFGSGGAGGAGETTSTWTGSTSSTSGATGTGGAGAGGPITPNHACWKDPPPGAAKPAPIPAYSGGACPNLVAGPNTITSGGAQRQFILALPSGYQNAEHAPVVFLWHWLGGKAESFYNHAEVQAAVDGQRFIAVIPEAKGDVVTKWPFLDGGGRKQEELRFFDDMLACVAAQYGINESCVASAGVSAGGLWTDQLAAARADHISSFISMSGGTGGVTAPWGNPGHKMPGLVLWGGPGDQCAGFSFASLSQNLEGSLTGNGNFMLECVHNCGHAEPPFEAPPGLSKYAGLWNFVFDHPFWLTPGESSYKANGVPPELPSWCSIGKGTATPRTGECTVPSGC